MLSLREKFISANHKPVGTYYLPDTLPILQSALKARTLLLQPEFSSVVIARHYPDLVESAAQVRESIAEISYSIDHDQACFLSGFDHDAGRDYLTVVETFEYDQHLLPVEVNVIPIPEWNPHFDTFNEKSCPNNRQHDAMMGGTIIIQAQAVSGTGLYCEKDLKENGFSPYYDSVRFWSFDTPGYDKAQPQIAPFLVAPGDIVVMRQGDWPDGFAPAIHTAPICNNENYDRTAYVTFGFAKPVFG